MSRLEKVLAGGGKLVAFTVAGDPTVEESYKAASCIIGAGADVLELGLPFSDPLADGPTIQEAGARALAAGMNTDRYFELVKRLNVRYETPLVCLTYYNILLRYGLHRFAEKCARSGIDGVIVPDLPLEESGPLRRELRQVGVDFIFLVAETTPEDRLGRILASASGFVYVVALLGTTGARKTVDPKLKSLIRRVKAKTRLPVAVGFGISTQEHVKAVIRMGADAAIVGSGIVKKQARGENVGAYVRSLAKAAKK